MTNDNNNKKTEIIEQNFDHPTIQLEIVKTSQDKSKHSNIEFFRELNLKLDQILLGIKNIF